MEWWSIREEWPLCGKIDKFDLNLNTEEEEERRNSFTLLRDAEVIPESLNGK